jgi:hypothetical protein
MEVPLSASTLRIRMYCQGLGDCFLLTFPCQGGARPEYHVLIDCGVISGTNNARNIINAVVQDIFETTQGHLDLVVGTHEHWDHVSGFNQARELFEKFKMDKIWLGWTEDPKDPWNLVKNRAAKIKALNEAANRMDNQALADTAVAAQQRSIRHVLSFFGEDLGASSSSGGKTTTRDALNFLSGHSDSEVTYCYPSKPPLSMDGVQGVRVYVLGPPENINYLKMNDPTKAGKTYGLTRIGGEDSFYAALSVLGQDTRFSRMKDLTYPFEATCRIDETQTALSDDADFFKTYYSFERGNRNEWRRIDTDWLDVTSELALNLDSDTNNTSLVLAFEIGKPGSGQVLLFAADAQVGNWLSWQDLSWKVKDGSNEVALTAHQLLERTILYKVGHHGSHNATLSELGLELMNNEGLVAMIPVDQEKAKDKGWDEMPFGPLLRTLDEKTKGRVIRIDDHDLPVRPADSRLNPVQWQQFVDKLSTKYVPVEGQENEFKLYVEYLLPFAPG